jgi:lipopolysaccharide cholinephosphotransferase
MIIHTPVGPYEYQPVDLHQSDKKPINKQQADDNLRKLVSILETAGIRHGLIYGTLLGAVRQGDFIDYDEDVDVFVLHEDKPLVMKALFELRDLGLEVIRYTGNMLSLMHGGDYIDLYFFKETKGQRRCGGLMHDAEYFADRDRVVLRSNEYWCPKAPIKFLESVYGPEWRVPKKNAPATPSSKTWKIWRWLVTSVLPPALVKLLRQSRATLIHWIRR